MLEKAVSGSAKPIQELHKRTIEFQERDRKKEEKRLETGIIYLPTWHKDRRIVLCAVPLIKVIIS